MPLRTKNTNGPRSSGELPAPTAEEIAALARELWVKRGSPEGSPEVDWYEAERRLKNRVIPSDIRSENHGSRLWALMRGVAVGVRRFGSHHLLPTGLVVLALIVLVRRYRSSAYGG